MHTTSVAFQADQPPSRRVLVASAVVVMACLGMFLFIAEDVLDGGGLISHDEAVLNWFVDNRSVWLTNAARWVSTVGGFASLCVVGVATGLWLWSRGTKPALAAAPLVALLLGGLASSVAKAVFGRDRPPVTLHAAAVGSSSFPSAHATDAAAFFIAVALALALTLARRSWPKVLLLAGGAALAGLVGLSRLVLGVHWLSDVVAGWALGTAVAITVVVLAWFGTSVEHRSARAPSSEPGDR